MQEMEGGQFFECVGDMERVVLVLAFTCKCNNNYYLLLYLFE